jgi:hypothetical protein
VTWTSAPPGSTSAPTAPARRGGHHLPAHLLPRRILGTKLNVLTGTIEKGWPAFLILSVGLNVACVVVTVFILSRRRWN